MTAEFKKLQREQYELFCHKQHDYEEYIRRNSIENR